MSELEAAGGAAESAIASTESAAPETAAPESGSTSEAPSTSADPDSELKAVWRRNNPDRGEDGKFTSDKVPEGEQNTESTPSTEAKVPEREQTKMPQSWSAEVTALWEKAPPDLKAHIAKREAEAHQTITTQGQRLKAYEPLAQLVEQNRETFDKYGVDPRAGINQLIAANDYLERDPVNAIRDLAQAYGVDLRQYSAAQRPPGQIGASPETAALHSEIQQLRQRLQDTDSRLSQRDQREAAAQFQAIENQVAKFAEDKADFEELADDVEEQILAIKAKNPGMSAAEVLEKAYDRARRVNPTVSARIEQAKRIEEQKKRAAEARKAAPLSVNSSPGNKSNPRTMEDTLRDVARKAYRK